jgi:hypothetical protein
MPQAWLPFTGEVQQLQSGNTVVCDAAQNGNLSNLRNSIREASIKRLFITI